MAKTIKDRLKDVTDRFRDVSIVKQQSIDNMKKVAEAAAKASYEAKK